MFMTGATAERAATALGVAVAERMGPSVERAAAAMGVAADRLKAATERASGKLANGAVTVSLMWISALLGMALLNRSGRTRQNGLHGST